MNLDKILQAELLPCVEKPSRYLGGEWNAVFKSRDVGLRLALVFPDLYDLGLGNLGIHILYDLLNDMEDVWAERAYAPAPDMEAALRARGLPLFAVESKDSLDVFDGLGFTLQSELNYTNILNIIDLAGIPLRTRDRTEDAPLTFAGGPSVFNPEPLAPFMDFFVIGDGEEAVVELAQLLMKHRNATRSEKLQAISALPGFYVPALYPMEVLPDGRILPVEDGPKIQKRVTRVLDGKTYPVKSIVPFTEQVHDRVSLEVLRGCTQGCRFCQAGMTTRPVRERSLEDISSLMERTLDATGYEEVSLVSLSTCDYSRVQQLVDNTAETARARRVAVSLPSLRLDSFSVGLADKVAGERRTGLTFAPEAASPRLRAVINKWIPDEDLLEMSAQAYERGWRHVKLYFMIGLPTERDDDVEAIADLTCRTVARGREIRPDARVHTGISTFVPKPFTPFQWAEQLDLGETRRRQSILSERFKRVSGVKFGRHNPRETWLEGLVTRSDRRAGDLIEAAFRNGARFDAWDEHLDFEAWEKAIAETGFDVADALRARDVDERLPWDHIDVMIPKSWFQEDWARAQALEHAPDCRHSNCHRCGVIDVERELCAHMLRDSIAGAKEEGTWTPRRAETVDPLDRGATTAPLGIRIASNDPPTRVVEPPAVQRVRFRVGRTEHMRFLSHLETANAWIRALRRAKAPLSFTQGFHAHARVNFSTAMPTAEASVGDYMDVVLSQRVEPFDLVVRLGEVLPRGLSALSAEEVPLRSPSLMSLVDGHVYTLHSTGVAAEVLKERIEHLWERETWTVRRQAKRRGRKVQVDFDVKPTVTRLVLEGQGEGFHVAFETRAFSGRLGKAREVLELLGLSNANTQVFKRKTLLRELPAPEAREHDPV